jgi:hypothetical protein
MRPRKKRFSSRGHFGGVMKRDFITNEAIREDFPRWNTANGRHGSNISELFPSGAIAIFKRSSE